MSQMWHYGTKKGPKLNKNAFLGQEKGHWEFSIEQLILDAGCNFLIFDVFHFGGKKSKKKDKKKS